ncbi:MAG: DUF615 domain-containing protein [Deltaproteobacteria bacterium HGW-Deltaproteobacteria-3]|nr:MAG: DUF615 domain-containing protein [Deltaproteobacteria bacterium HGW-Deltaproteobacteria-3]
MATKKSSSRDTDPQEIYVSRSEKKRLAKNIEEIAKELVELSPAHIKKLPADDLLKAELSNSRDLKGGALKRQTKFIAGLLRESGTDEILAFLAERKGSHLKQTGAFHELERLREDIITEVLAAREEAWHNHEHLTERSALRYAATRKPVHRREIFRQLHAAMERQQFAETAPPTAED